MPTLLTNVNRDLLVNKIFLVDYVQHMMRLLVRVQMSGYNFLENRRVLNLAQQVHKDVRSGRRLCLVHVLPFERGDRH